MREILFRGKRTDNGEWVHGNLIKRNIWSSEFYVIRVEDNGFDSYVEYEVIPETVGQYTGLTDKNGKKIFEGDIVRADNGHISEITFHFGAFRCYCQCHDELNTLWSDILTVIGNIHDNVELLKATEN